MRKLIVSANLSLDGVTSAPEHWFGPYMSGDLGASVKASLPETDTLLLGRVTYQEFAAHWPAQPPDESGFPQFLNSVAKYVASSRMQKSDWHNTTITNDVVGTIRTLKQQNGKHIVVLGSATLVRSLMEANLVDSFELFVAPIVLGQGKRLFADGVGQTLRLVETKAFDSGVVLLSYESKHST